MKDDCYFSFYFSVNVTSYWMLLFQSVTEDDNSNILPSKSEPEPVATVADSTVEAELPATLEISAPSSSFVPETAVQEPVIAPAKEEPPRSTSLPPATSDADDGVVAPASVSVVMVENCVLTAEDSVLLAPVETTVATSQRRESIVPTATGRAPVTPSLLDVKRQRQQARERQRNMLMHGCNIRAGDSGMAPLSVKTNGAMTNGVDSGASPRHITEDDTAYLGTHHKYSKRYDIAAPDKKDACCVVM